VGLKQQKKLLSLLQERRLLRLERKLGPWLAQPAEWQPLIYVRETPEDGVQNLWLAEIKTASLDAKRIAARDIRKLATVDGPAGAGAAEVFVWAIIAPGGRAAIAFSEQFGSAFDPFIDFNVRVVPFEPGGPSLFANEHSFSVGPANCSSALFDSFIATLRDDMASEGLSQAEIDAHVASLSWEPVPDAVQWAPAVTLLAGGRIAIQFQLDIEEPSSGWLGEERFTGTWSGLGGAGPMQFEGWTSQGAGAYGPASGPPARFGLGILPVTPGPTGAARRILRVDGRILGFASGGLPKRVLLRKNALLAHAMLRRSG